MNNQKEANGTLQIVSNFLQHIRDSPAPHSFDEHWTRWIDFRRHYEEFTRKLIEENTESPIEAIMYLHLRDWMINHPVLVETQVPISKYRVDFLLSTSAKKVVVECDGHDYHERTKQQARRDKQRDRELTKCGYTVLRFTGSEIWENPWNVIREIEELMFPSEE